jgi:predicted DNA-binding protein (MmcQ/YjbR family)
MSPSKFLERLRRICLSLPGSVEGTSFGHPTFRAGKKTFAVFENYRGEDTLCVKATLEDQALLVLDPTFFEAPYVGKHGWTSMRTSGELDWDEVVDLVTTSYRLVAPKSLLARLPPVAQAGPFFISLPRKERARKKKK